MAKNSFISIYVALLSIFDILNWNDSKVMIKIKFSFKSKQQNLET